MSEIKMNTHNNPKFIDLTGKKFGKYLVLGKSINIKRCSMWLCQCSCGNKKNVNAVHLKKGVATQCITCRRDSGDKIDPKIRFFSKIEKSKNCWIWIGPKFQQGYGIFHLRVEKEKYLSRTAHTFSYEIHKGTIPEGMCVCHTCDNPSCVNPDHLFLGTHKENTHDMIAKGRSKAPKGEECGRSKLSEAQALEIKRLHPKYNYKNLGKLFGVTRQTISRIVRGENWKHL